MYELADKFSCYRPTISAVLKNGIIVMKITLPKITFRKQKDSIEESFFAVVTHIPLS